MRQADSTIKGFLYQFNKSILTILESNDSDSIVLEGVIEDIDIQSPASTTTIQCKYHEDKRFQISSIAAPVLEMLCHYCKFAYLGKPVSYVLYAYYAENVDNIDISAFIDFLGSTRDKEILTKYFHQIYTVPDSQMLAIANKAQKSKSEKEQLVNYYKTNRAALKLRVDIQDFWNCFTYVRAEQFDVLRERVIQNLEQFADHDTVVSMYYPNAFSLVASLSAKTTDSERTVKKSDLINFLTQQKSVLLNQWTLEVLDREQILKTKKTHLASAFASNPDVRAFVFSDSFLDNTKNDLIVFIYEYINKYFKKPKLQKQPIFIFGNQHSTLMQSVLLELYKYQRPVNTGLVGSAFVADSFIDCKNCSPDFVCRIALLKDMTIDILEKCQVNQLYIIGGNELSLVSPNFFVEELNVPDIGTLKYLVGLSRSLEA